MPTTSHRAQGWHPRGYLPHLDAPGLIQHITFHLADSLPIKAIERMRAELQDIPEPEQALARRRRIQALLDSGLGSCLLSRVACARIVEDILLFGDATRYRLLAWVVMPNHVHVLIEQSPGWPLGKIVQSWKRHTSRQIHRLGFDLGAPTCSRQQDHAEYNSAIPGVGGNSASPGKGLPLWQRDYWDRFIRNEAHFLAVKRYIEQNPVQAGLVGSAERWEWGSARFGGQACRVPLGDPGR